MTQSGGCGPCDASPGSGITLVIGADKTFYLDLYYSDTGEPFDLTNATQIVATFPGASGAPVEEKLTGNENVAVMGAPGAGKISVTVPASDSALLLENPNGNQLQDLQINVTASSKTYVFIMTAVLNIVPPSYTVT
jgi:hypothetical protein